MNHKLKRILSITVIVAGALLALSGAAPMIISAVLEAQIPESVGVIGGADGPTAIVVSGVQGAGHVIAEIVIGIILIAAGIWGCRKCK